MLTKSQIEQIQQIENGPEIGYAYIYPYGNREREEMVFNMTPANIAHFIGARQFDVKAMVLTDQMDVTILNTIAGFIDRCKDHALCDEIKKILIPIQLGEEDAMDVVAVSRKLYEEYQSMEPEKAAVKS